MPSNERQPTRVQSGHCISNMIIIEFNGTKTIVMWINRIVHIVVGARQEKKKAREV